MNARHASRENLKVAFEQDLIRFIPADRIDDEVVRIVSKKDNRQNLFNGLWPITSMTGWDQDFVDEEVSGNFEFSKDGFGEFQFGYVRCGIGGHDTERDGQPAVEFSFDGMDEMPPTSGRGWGVLNGDIVNGMIFFHQGDKSGFTATKAAHQ